MQNNNNKFINHGIDSHFQETLFFYILYKKKNTKLIINKNNYILVLNNFYELHGSHSFKPVSRYWSKETDRWMQIKREFIEVTQEGLPTEERQ